MTEPFTSVIAIDPGERVGYAVGRMRTNELRVDSHGVMTLKDFAVGIYTETYNMVSGESWGSGYDVLVYETWRLRPAVAKAFIGNDMQPSQLVGIVRCLGWLTGTKLQGYGPEKKMIAQATMPQWLQDRKAQSNEEHDKDALDLLWHHYFTQYHDPSAT